MTTSTPRRVLAALLVLGALAWLPLNKPVEGPTLLVLTPRHGVTMADLLSVAAVLIALVVLLPGATERRERATRRSVSPAQQALPTQMPPPQQAPPRAPSSGPHAGRGQPLPPSPRPDRPRPGRMRPPPRAVSPVRDQQGAGSMPTQPVRPVQRPPVS